MQCITHRSLHAEASVYTTWLHLGHYRRVTRLHVTHIDLLAALLIHTQLVQTVRAADDAGIMLHNRARYGISIVGTATELLVRQLPKVYVSVDLLVLVWALARRILIRLVHLPLFQQRLLADGWLV